ncbi:MAG: purine-nucleoside phosphorylase [Campylobacteraceae bacterium 4484_4]|nr:MAG: purine-nucleoside phosphorylase [Campylobacteraceae bacterium 4484_4]
MIICAGDSEQFDFATPIGIGMVNAAVNLTKLCLLNPPEFLLFVGTAGSYGNKNIFDIIESRTAANIENSFFTHNSYTPIDNVISTADDVSRETIVNSSNYITTDSDVAKHYLNNNIQLENMEFFAVLKAAEELKIPAGGVFIVTNYCDKEAHKVFIQNRLEAMGRLTDYMKGRITL